MDTGARFGEASPASASASRSRRSLSAQAHRRAIALISRLPIVRSLAPSSAARIMLAARTSTRTTRGARAISQERPPRKDAPRAKEERRESGAAIGQLGEVAFGPALQVTGGALPREPARLRGIGAHSAQVAEAKRPRGLAHRCGEGEREVVRGPLVLGGGRGIRGLAAEGPDARGIIREPGPQVFRIVTEVRVHD